MLETSIYYMRLLQNTQEKVIHRYTYLSAYVGKASRYYTLILSCFAVRLSAESRDSEHSVWGGCAHYLCTDTL